MQKWIVLCAGIILQAILGGIYAWSAFVPPLTDSFSLTKGQCGSIFGLTIAIFSLAMIPAGRMLQKKGPRLTAATGAILFTCGYILASFSGGNYLMLLVSFGLLIGTGIGFGYVCPLTTGMKWFPDNRGLVTGVAVAGFGGGAIILSSLTEHLLTSGYDVLSIFRLTGVVFGSLALFSSMFMSEPAGENGQNGKNQPLQLKNYLLTQNFALIFLGMFAGTFAGLLIIGNLKPMMLKMGLNEFNATLTISLFALGNIVGRIFWGQVHDRTGSRKTLLISLVFFFVSLLLLQVDNPEWLPLLTTTLVGAGFGGCFVVYASTVVDKFGVKLFPRLYPVVFLAYGLAALTGPALGGWLADTTDSYQSGILVSLAVIFIAAIIIACIFDRQPLIESDSNEELAKA